MILVDGNKLNDIYYNGYYAQALYLGSTLLWRKGNKSPEKELADKFKEKGISTKSISSGLTGISDMYYDKENNRFLIASWSGSSKGGISIIDEKSLSKKKITSSQVSTVCYGNSKIIGAYSKKIFIFDKYGNAISEKSYSSFGGGIKKIRFYNGKFIAIMTKGYVYTSVDGITWDKLTTNTTVDLVDIAYGDGRFVIVGATKNTLIYSDDNGITWTEKHYTYQSVKDGFLSVSYSSVDNVFLLCRTTYDKDSLRATYIVDKDTLKLKYTSTFTNSERDYTGTYSVRTNGYLTFSPASYHVSWYRLNYSYDLGKTYGYANTPLDYKRHIVESCFGINRVLFGYNNGSLRYSNI